MPLRLNDGRPMHHWIDARLRLTGCPGPSPPPAGRGLAEASRHLTPAPKRRTLSTPSSGKKVQARQGFAVPDAFGVYGSQSSDFRVVALVPPPDQVELQAASRSSTGKALMPSSTAILKLVPRTAFRVPASTWYTSAGLNWRAIAHSEIVMPRSANHLCASSGDFSRTAFMLDVVAHP